MGSPRRDGRNRRSRSSTDNCGGRGLGGQHTDLRYRQHRLLIANSQEEYTEYGLEGGNVVQTFLMVDMSQ